ncbi:hypothetical protein [Nocardioides sp. TF02-7]|uniref:hypothetical protein n=1 Tax=Nocardioides sp. TF02-7 TaxID=2917724 RepID=UPI001F05F016|nr:hypothetical protein [Nocardioides sp. TF02-7]UMG92781.1 hypothetical protein MF408_24305 [Nocardioides sp. TF02-7]
MTEQLKTLMDRAADVDFAALDIDAVTAAGDRVVRRRRIARGLAGLTAAAATVTGVVLVAGDRGADRSDVADSLFRSDVPTWTTGSTLHTPDATYDLGVGVVSYVRTSAGIVFVGHDGGVYSFTGGRPERIGATEDPALRADPGAPYAAWVDGTGRDRATVVFDQGTGRRAWAERAGSHQASRVVAIDDGTAYLSREPGATRTVDLASGAEGTLAEPGSFRHLRAVGGDWAAWAIEKDGGRTPRSRSPRSAAAGSGSPARAVTARRSRRMASGSASRESGSRSSTPAPASSSRSTWAATTRATASTGSTAARCWSSRPPRTSTGSLFSPARSRPAPAPSRRRCPPPPRRRSSRSAWGRPSRSRAGPPTVARCSAWRS